MKSQTNNAKRKRLKKQRTTQHGKYAKNQTFVSVKSQKNFNLENTV